MEDADARRVQLERDIDIRVDGLRRDADTAYSAKVEALETEAAGQLAVTRHDAETALAILATELEAQAAGQVEAAVRAAQEEAAQMLVETTKQHDVALASLRAEAQADGAQAEARRAQLERDLGVRVEEVRREANTAHASQAAAFAAQAAERLESTRRDAETALAAQKTQLEAQAAAQIEAAVREARHEAVCAAAEIAQQHEATLTAVRAQLEDTEARRAQLERDLVVRVDIVRRKESTAHAARQLSLQPRQARRTGDRPGGGGG